MLLNYFPALLPVSFISRCRFSLVLLSMVLLSACGSDSSPDTDTGTRTVPQNVTLSTGTRINDINWSGVGGARGYTVYWSTEPDVNPTTGTTYYITYSATDTAGNTSTATRTVNVIAETGFFPFYHHLENR